MYFDAIVASDIAKLEMARAERNAALAWRFRNHRTPTSKALTAVITSLVSLFIR